MILIADVDGDEEDDGNDEVVKEPIWNDEEGTEASGERESTKIRDCVVSVDLDFSFC